ncbi:MAG: hypothetical protein K6U14_06870 [Firmicutes bacterium]|nr:hypothetical protein [Alicyclobacillaceae bacterium]MCL6497341.1 hypothetical protein [Bacillota bacterium]
METLLTRYQVNIYHDLRDQVPVDTCQGPTPSGACPRQAADGTVACRGRCLRIALEEPARLARAAWAEDLSRWCWRVDEHATTCPLAALGLH